MATTDAFGVRRKDTTRGPPLRVLSLDGGGVRGYSMLIILQELMHRTFVETHGRAPKRNEIPKPCDHFDLIVGTGTGGLIALMLGRLRMNLETCKDVYVRMTKRVFETDKTFAGIPYRSTLFKASKLEEAIRECVREHTVFDDDGNDEGKDLPADANLPNSPTRSNLGHPQRTGSSASRYSLIGESQNIDHRSQVLAARYGKPNASLYDSRTKRTKTAVTAVYRGTPRGSSSILLRSYDSRAETAVEPKCTVWEAGRATCATALAFKPIQIGQSVFLDEGAGKYNPAPQALDEALLNEWPGREIGVFVSIGTGKRPADSNAQQHLWWEGFVSSGMGDFAEARRRLISKIEGCEETHQYMLKKHLLDRNVDPTNYYRLNVIAGVGEFGMNEWNRLAEISTNTRRYLAETQVQNLNLTCAVKLAKIHLAKARWDRAARGEAPLSTSNRLSWEIEEARNPDGTPAPKPPLVPDAVELPAENFTYGDGPVPSQHPYTYGSQGPNNPIPQVLISPQNNRLSWANSSADEGDKFTVQADEPHTYDPLRPEPLQVRRSQDIPRPLRTQVSQQSLPMRGPSGEYTRPSGEYTRPMPSNGFASGPGGVEHGAAQLPPPRPPKTPIQGGDAYVPGPTSSSMGLAASAANSTGGRSRPSSGSSAGRPAGGALPYPVGDGPPPVVNLARKPELGRG